MSCIDGFVQDCGISSVVGMEITQYSPKLLIYLFEWIFLYVFQLIS